MGFPNEPINPTSDSSEGQGQDNNIQETGTQETGSINPAWNDVLGLIPESLHSQIVPHFKKWDSGVQERFQQVHSQYKPYKEYESFIESQIPPDELRMGYGLLQAVYQKPQEVIKAIQNTFNLSPQEAQALLEQQGDAEDEEENSNPYANIPPQFMEEFMQMKKQTELQGRILLGQREQELAQQQSKALDDEIDKLKKTYGDFDDTTTQVILSRAYQLNGDLDTAAKEIFSLIEAQLVARNKPKPPVLLGQNSGPIPENVVDPRKLSERDTRTLVAKMLEDAARSQD